MPISASDSSQSLTTATVLNQVKGLNSLPNEVIIQVIRYLPQLTALLFCLTQKKYFALIDKQYVRWLNEYSSRRQPLLCYLEQDLPWNFYRCRYCQKIHKLQYEQARCQILFMEPTWHFGFVPHLQQNNINIACRYLMHICSDGKQEADVTTSYFYERNSIRCWGHVDVKMREEGLICHRYRNWLRWTSNMVVGGDRTAIASAYKGYLCPHLEAMMCHESPFGLIWKLNPDNARQMLAFIPRAGLYKPPETLFHTPNLDRLSDMPEHWLDSGLCSCPMCETEVIVHFGISRIKPVDDGVMKLDRYPYDLIYPPAGHICDFHHSSQEEGNGGLLKKVMNLIRKEKSPMFWCDTVVITKWKIGKSLDKNILHRAQQQRKVWTPSVGHKLCSIKGAFDGKPDMHYHPSETVTEKSFPLQKAQSAITENISTPTAVPSYPPSHQYHRIQALPRNGHTQHDS